MKLLGRFLSLATLISTVIFLSNCGSENGPTKTEQELQAEKLVGTWKINSNTDVKFGGGTPAQAFANMTLVLSGSTSLVYQADGRPTPSPWDSQGALTFGTPVTSQLVRDDDPVTNITYVVTATTLKMNFEFSGDGYDGDAGRVKSVEGSWEFNFTKQ